MELFNETKNKYYEIISELIFTFCDKKNIESEELCKLFPPELNNNFKLKNSLLNKSGSDSLFILNEKDKKYSLNVDSPVPIIPTLIEKEWLKYMLTDYRAGIFLNKETIDKLLDALDGYEDITSKNIIIQHKSNNIIKNYDELKTKMQILIKAIKNNASIAYSYKTNDGIILKNKISVPYKIEYSLDKDKFYLISFSTEEERPIKSIIENLIDLNIIDYNTSITKDYIKKSINAKKHDKYVIVEVKNINNCIERAFLTFSSYSKNAKYIEDEDIHELEIFYYSFEEKEIFKKIFSLGKGVVVKEPEYIKSEILNLIEETLSLYD